MKKRELLWIILLVGCLVYIFIPKNTPSTKFDKKAFQHRLDSLSNLIANNNHSIDSLKNDCVIRDKKLKEMSVELNKLNEKSKYYEAKYKKELALIDDMSDDDIISAFTNSFK